MPLSAEICTPSLSSANAITESAAAPDSDCPAAKRRHGAPVSRPLTTTLRILVSLIAATSASVVVTHFSAAPISAIWQTPGDRSQRIGARKAVTRDPPLAVVAFPEDEKLLVGFRAGRAGGVDLLSPCGIRPHEGPLRRHHHELGDGEPHLQGDGLEYRVIGAAHR